MAETTETAAVRTEEYDPEESVNIYLSDLPAPEDHSSWLQAQIPGAPPATDEAVRKITELGHDTHRQVAEAVHREYRANGGDFPAALAAHKDFLDEVHHWYRRRVKSAQRMGIPEPLFREGIDEKGSDVGFLQSLGALD